MYASAIAHACVLNHKKTTAKEKNTTRKRKELLFEQKFKRKNRMAPIFAKAPSYVKQKATNKKKVNPNLGSRVVKTSGS